MVGHIVKNIRALKEELIIEPDDLREVILTFLRHLNTPDLKYTAAMIDLELQQRICKRHN